MLERGVRMKRLLVAWVLAAAVSGAQTVFHVNPQSGCDGHAGSAEQPFAALSSAREDEG